MAINPREPIILRSLTVQNELGNSNRIIVQQLPTPAGSTERVLQVTLANQVIRISRVELTEHTANQDLTRGDISRWLHQAGDILGTANDRYLHLAYNVDQPRVRSSAGSGE